MPTPKPEPYDVAAAQALCDAATPGPWKYDSYAGVFAASKIEPHDHFADEQEAAGWPSTDEDEELKQRYYEIDPTVCSIPALYGDTAGPPHAQDAEFIAGSRTLLPAAIQTIIALEVVLTEAKEWLDDVCHSEKEIATQEGVAFMTRVDAALAGVTEDTCDETIRELKRELVADSSQVRVIAFDPALITGWAFHDGMEWRCGSFNLGDRPALDLICSYTPLNGGEFHCVVEKTPYNRGNGESQVEARRDIEHAWGAISNTLVERINLSTWRAHYGIKSNKPKGQRTAHLKQQAIDIALALGATLPKNDKGDWDDNAAEAVCLCAYAMQREVA